MSAEVAAQRVVQFPAGQDVLESGDLSGWLLENAVELQARVTKDTALVAAS